MIDFPSVMHAYQDVRRELLAKRSSEGHWTGELESSAFASATAASALCVIARSLTDEARAAAYQALAWRTVGWLAGCQNEDGGWGDTRKSPSRLATTLLVRACYHLVGAAGQHTSALERAGKYIELQGGLGELRRQCGRDKTLLSLILTNCALAGQTAWKEVPALAFEFSWLPQPMQRVLGLSSADYAAPAMVASGQARYFHRQPRNPLAWMARRLSVRTSLRMLQWMQPPSGGFFEAVPLTSFVVMSLASTGRSEHSVTRRGAGFLLDAVKPDASWSIDTNLAVRGTSMAVGSLAAASGDVGALGCTSWLLRAQQRDPNPLTRAAPGGWSWNPSMGAAPSANDTGLALLALTVLQKSNGASEKPLVIDAAMRGIDWLLEVQNDDGGWPLFSRGHRNLPLEHSAADNTAAVLRGLCSWQDKLALATVLPGSETAASKKLRVTESIRRGLEFLQTSQRRDGSWTAVGFGNSHWPRNENPVCGTALALLAYRDLGRMNEQAAQRGLQWLVANVDAGGGWGGGRAPQPGTASVEETALAVEALLAGCNSTDGTSTDGKASDSTVRLRPVIDEALQWLVRAVREGRHRTAAPIGVHLTGLWYEEALNPLAFTVSALGHAVRQLASATSSES